ncbi:hypothetical protein K4H01_24690, partial [Mycobacterium tuberculosis]|nr:hypothetical protein [Mycobacterium tuberculosis]
AGGITAIPFPAARCLFIASGHGSGRPWNTAAVRLFDGKDMPRKRLEGHSSEKGDRLAYTVTDASQER